MSDPIQSIALQLHIKTFGDGLLAKISQTIDLLQDAALERDQLKADSEALRKVANELLGSAECSNVHHCEAEQHEFGEPCKVLARIYAVLSQGEKPGD